jgi:hypothetical protein
MKREGYLRAQVHVYKEDGKVHLEHLDIDVIQYGHFASEEDAYDGWLHEEVTVDDDYLLSYLEGLPNDDNYYELIGDIYGAVEQSGTYEYPEAEYVWELRDYSVKPIHKKWLEEWDEKEKGILKEMR